jgi:hypothetical protein
MTNTEDLLNGFAALIAGSVAGVTWSPTAIPVNGGIVLKTMPDKPDRVIVLNIIPMAAEVSNPRNTVMLQVATRGIANDPIDCDRLADPILDILHGAKGFTVGAITVMQCNWTSGIPMGQDALFRSERVDKYYIDFAPPPTANRPTAGSW